MKKVSIIFLFFIASIINAHSQNSELPTTEQFLSKIDSLVKLNVASVIATNTVDDNLSIQLKCNKVPIYTLQYNLKTKETEQGVLQNLNRIPLTKIRTDFRITRVSGVTYNGFLNDINIFGVIEGDEHDTLKFLYATPVSIRNIQNEKVIRRAWLDRQDSHTADLGLDRTCFLWLKDVFIINNETGSAYLPADVSFELHALDCDSPSTTIKSNQQIFKFQRGLSDIFNASIYTDALALFGKYPNGLVQVEAYLSYHPNVRPLGNTGFILAHYVRALVTYSRLDASDQIYYIGDNSSFNLVNFQQRSFLCSDLTFGLLGYYFKGRRVNSESLVYLDLGYSMNMIQTSIIHDSLSPTQLRDTIPYNNNKGILMHSPYLQLGVHFNLQRNLSIQLNSYYYLEFFGNVTADSLGVKLSYNKGDFSNIGQLFRIQSSIAWSPNGGPHSIFVRSAATFNMGIEKVGNPQAYYQLQIGYSIDFSTLIGMATTNKTSSSNSKSKN